MLTLGRNNTFVAASPSAYLQQGHKMCVKLVFSDGRVLTCTPDHLIWTTEGWVRADQLRSKQSRVILGPEAPLYDPTEDESPHLAAFNLSIGEVAQLVDE